MWAFGSVGFVVIAVEVTKWKRWKGLRRRVLCLSLGLGRIVGGRCCVA